MSQQFDFRLEIWSLRIAYSSVISACSHQHWPASLQTLHEAQREPGQANLVVFNAAISACERGNASWAVATGGGRKKTKARLAPSAHPKPRKYLGSEMGEFTYQPKMVPWV